MPRLPAEGKPRYFPDTRHLVDMLVARRRAVRVSLRPRTPLDVLADGDREDLW